MAISWHDLGSKIKVRSTAKLFFSKYLYSVRMLLPHAYMLRQWRSEQRFSEFVTHTIAHPGRSAANGQVVAAHAVLLEHESKFDFKITVCNGILYIYGDDEQGLFAMVSEMPGAVTTVTRPNSNAATSLLLAGQVIMPKCPHKFKVVCRERKMSKDERAVVQRTLAASETSMINPTLKKFLTDSDADLAWTPSTAFYTNDEKMLLMLQMVAPSFIREILSVAQCD